MFSFLLSSNSFLSVSFIHFFDTHSTISHTHAIIFPLSISLIFTVSSISYKPSQMTLSFLIPTNTLTPFLHTCSRSLHIINLFFIPMSLPLHLTFICTCTNTLIIHDSISMYVKERRCAYSTYFFSHLQHRILFNLSFPLYIFLLYSRSYPSSLRSCTISFLYVSY